MNTYLFANHVCTYVFAKRFMKLCGHPKLKWSFYCPVFFKDFRLFLMLKIVYGWPLSLMAPVIETKK